MAFAKLAAEFPDFDQATLPAIPATWEDDSWHNEPCPAFAIGDVRVFIDFPEPADREFPECKRFIAKWDMATERLDEVSIQTDDWNEVLAWVLAHQFADTLLTEIGAENFEEMRHANYGLNGSCASHDYCDANMTMDAAFTETMGREAEINDETPDGPLWNAAWDIAKRDRLTASGEEALHKEFADFVAEEGIDFEGDAMEMIMAADLTDTQRTWISGFILRWEAMREAEDAAEPAKKEA